MKAFYLGMFSLISVLAAGKLAAGEIDTTMIVRTKAKQLGSVSRKYCDGRRNIDIESRSQRTLE
jgi:hypothetical protein